ncbi:MAG: GTP 3',8-cyclase MoaA [Nitrospiraceae bacterium]|nr:GTP 3',8-cyclase MoaA [Nitrospiraceae bacterium]
MELRDTFDRRIDYIRVSVTDRCNLRCVYCVPDGAPPRCLKPSPPLAAEKLIAFLKVAKRYGLRKVRLTGGEPLLRKDITRIVRAIKDIGVEDLGLTTNGQLLPLFARRLKRAGLDRVNISLDSLRPERYRRITGGGCLRNVYRAIESACGAGLAPVKVNVVLIRGINDDEIGEFAAIALERDWHIRFIELMPVRGKPMPAGRGFSSLDGMRVTADEAKKSICDAVGRLVPIGRSGSSDNYRFWAGGAGVIGFISPMSHHFCDSCNRLRITAAGKIRPCLFSDCELDLNAVSNENEMERLLLASVRGKAKGSLLKKAVPCEAMSLIGG